MEEFTRAESRALSFITPNMKMEEAIVEGRSENHLENVLSENEILSVPNEVANKINIYIDKKFEEYLTAKALHETSKSEIGDKISSQQAQILELTTKYEEASQKLHAAEETNLELGKQIESLNDELDKARHRIIRLENEVISLKSARDAAVDEINDLTRIIQRRDTEIERLTTNEAALEQRLRAAIDAKCEALALNDEFQSKELSLLYREKRIEQERTVLKSEIAGLTEEVNRLSSELKSSRLNSSTRIVSLETEVAEKTEELNTANQKISQLNDVIKNLNNHVENLTQQLREQREIEHKITENYKRELDAKIKLADLFKSMCDDNEAKTMEVTEGIAELQKFLNEAAEKYGELETKYQQAEVDHEEILEKKNEIISSLKNELEHANDLIKAAQGQNLEMALNELAPSAANASKLLKSGMSLTHIYSQLVKVSEDLTQEKEENRQLRITINTIVQELEEKAPLLQKQKNEYDEAMENNTALTQQMESLLSECNRLRDECNESNKIANHYNRENSRLKGELTDLGRQVCFLLKEIEHSRGGLPNGDHDLQTASNTSSESSRIISKTLVTFSDIQELQSNNQKLLRMVRDLTEKQEELERKKDQFESSEMQGKIEALKNRVDELTEAQDRQTKMVNGLIRQRDMFKKLYHDLMQGKRSDINSSLTEDTNSAMEVSLEKCINTNLADQSIFEVKCKETEKQLMMLREEYKAYRGEKVTNERMLYEQIDNMRQEISKLTAANSKAVSTSEYNNERLRILQANINTYKKQIASLEEKNKAYSATVAKHEVSLQHLREEALNAQSKLATAEVQLEKVKMECKLLKDAELRLKTEKEMLNRERQGQALLLKNLELIKASVERVEVENHSKIESRLDEAWTECSALRRRLQEEQDRFRELAAHLESQTETAKLRMQEEKDAADTLRKELTLLRQDLDNKIKSKEELENKLKLAISPNSDGSFDTVKRIRELENKLTERDEEIKSLQEQLSMANEHIRQYCDLAEDSEKELKTLNTEYEKYKNETEAKLEEYIQKAQSLEGKCSELETELSLHRSGEHSVINANLKNELAKVKEELEGAQTELESSRSELEQARAEVSKLSESVTKAEENYTHEIILHSTDIQVLSQVKEEFSKAQNQINELVAQKNSALEQMESAKASWEERQKIFTAENEQLADRLKNLNDQNTLLHNQIQALGKQLSASHASRSRSESMNESANDSSLNISVGEDEIKSSDQFFQIVKFLRKEKDIAVAKFDILEAETIRLKSQLEISEKQHDETKMALAAERERSEVTMMSINKQSDILRKVETLNALTDSNRILRQERDYFAARVEELTTQLKSMDEQLGPLQERISDITSKNDTLQSENTALKADCARWRTRVNALVERANTTSPEDWKRLQNERDALAKLLTAEKENVKKLNEEVEALKVERSKLEEQCSSLTQQQGTFFEENRKLSEELSVVKEDITRVTEELTKVKVELAAAREANVKLTEELASTNVSLKDIKNKEMQIRKIAIKYKTQYEELMKQFEDEKKRNEGEVAAATSAAAESAKKVEEQLTEIQAQLGTERANSEKLKQELHALRTDKEDKEEKTKKVLKQAKSKICELTERNSSLSRELDESRTKIESLEQSTRDEQDVRLALIKSQYEGRLSRLEKELSEAQTERTREVEALMQKVNLLQRQLANQATGPKQQSTTEKTTTDPPTANIKPMAGVVQQSVNPSRRGGEPPLASIRPMAQVGPTAPHEHTTEYMPASSSRPARTHVTAPPESTQDMDTSEAGMGTSGSSDSTAQPSSHSQDSKQAVALVMPRIEHIHSGTSSASAAVAPASSAPAPTPPVPGPASSVPVTAAASQPSTSVSTSHPPAGVSTSQPPGVSTSQPPGVSTSQPPGVSTSQPPGVSTSQPPGVSTSQPPGVSTSQPPGVSTSQPPGASIFHPPGVSTSHPPSDARPQKRRLQPRPLTAKRTRVQGSVEVEYQVPTSSRCDQEDEGVIVVDSEEDDERCSGTMYREGDDEDDDDMGEEEEEAGEEEEEEEDDDDENSMAQDSPAQSPEAGEEAEEGENSLDESGGAAGGAGEGEGGDSQPAPTSGTEPSGALSLGGNGADEGDDSIVPSTPTLYVPRRVDGFGEAVVSPLPGGASASARFTFGEAAASGAPSHHDTHADLTAALPPAHTARGEAGEWGEETRNEEEPAAVSSQGSEPSSPHQPAEEGREAEASSAPPPARRPPVPPAHSPHHHQRWMRAADSESGPRGRGMRSRRPMRRPHYRY